MKTALTIAMLFGAMVCGGVIVTAAQHGDLFKGLLLGAGSGVVSALMGLGILTVFLKKEVKESLKDHGRPTIPGTPIVTTGQQTGARFEFADGKRIGPQEYGYATTQWAFDEAARGLNNFWRTTNLEGALPGAELVNAKPILARLYLTALTVGAYHAYAEAVLRADHATMAGVVQGASDCLDVLSLGDGKTLAATEKAHMLKSFWAFKNAVIADINDTTPPGTFRPMLYLKGSQLFFASLDHVYRGANGERPFLLEGAALAQHMMGITLLDHEAQAVLEVLHKHHKVRLVGG